MTDNEAKTKTIAAMVTLRGLILRLTVSNLIDRKAGTPNSPDSRALLADAQGTRELIAQYAADLTQEEFTACLMAAGMLD